MYAVYCLENNSRFEIQDCQLISGSVTYIHIHASLGAPHFKHEGLLPIFPIDAYHQFVANRIASLTMPSPPVQSRVPPASLGQVW